MKCFESGLFVKIAWGLRNVKVFEESWRTMKVSRAVEVQILELVSVGWETNERMFNVQWGKEIAASDIYVLA